MNIRDIDSWKFYSEYDEDLSDYYIDDIIDDMIKDYNDIRASSFVYDKHIRIDLFHNSLVTYISYRRSTKGYGMSDIDDYINDKIKKKMRLYNINKLMDTDI